jgi:hypothetical protein
MLSEIAKIQDHHPESDILNLLLTTDCRARDANGDIVSFRVHLFGKDHEGGVVAKMQVEQNVLVVQFNKHKNGIEIFDENLEG